MSKNSICFSGGGIKGAAHIGAIKAIEEMNLHFDYISGTSSGSIIATLYAIGYSSNEMLQIFKEYCRNIKYFDFKSILKLLLSIPLYNKVKFDGLNSGKIIEKKVKKITSQKGIYNISDIKKPIFIPSVDLKTGNLIVFTSIKPRYNFSDKTIYINDMDISTAVKASCSYPRNILSCKNK